MLIIHMLNRKRIVRELTDDNDYYFYNESEITNSALFNNHKVKLETLTNR